MRKGKFFVQLPDDFPHPSALIFGCDLSGKIIHVVCGVDENFLYLITAYVSTTKKFLDDSKTRRQK